MPAYLLISCSEKPDALAIRNSKGGPHRFPQSCRQPPDRKSTRLNSSHVRISYAVFCLKKKNDPTDPYTGIPPLDIVPGRRIAATVLSSNTQLESGTHTAHPPHPSQRQFIPLPVSTSEP